MNLDNDSLARWARLQQLLGECARAGDTGDLGAFLACFTSDATLEHHGETTHENRLPHTVKGHGEIRAYREALSRLPVRRHQLTNFIIIEQSSDYAIAETQVTVVALDTYGARVIRLCKYVDRFTLENGRWLIAHRVIEFLSLSG